MIILAGFSFIVSNLGLTKLIQVSIPVLTAIYPPCIVLVALSFCIGLWHSATRILAPVMLVSWRSACSDALKAAGLGQDFPQWLLHLPLAEQGLARLIPSVATSPPAAWSTACWASLRSRRLSRPQRPAACSPAERGTCRRAAPIASSTHGPAGACRRRQRFFPRSAERISTIEQDDF